MNEEKKPSSFEVDSDVGIGIVIDRHRTEEQWKAAIADVERRLKEANERGAFFGEPLLDSKMFDDLRVIYTRIYSKHVTEADLNLHDAVVMVNHLCAMASVLGCSVMTFARTFAQETRQEDALDRFKQHIHEIIDFSIARESEKFAQFIKETGFTSEAGIRKH